jgi:hypothetical protein
VELEDYDDNLVVKQQLMLNNDEGRVQYEICYLYRWLEENIYDDNQLRWVEKMNVANIGIENELLELVMKM